MKSNIVLIGMPGCGKSTCGVLIAKALCKSFIDTDLLLQQREKMPLQSIINTRGTGHFRRAEEDCLCSLNCENAVISTGGSAVYYEKAMRHLGENGAVIYLKISLEEMLRRISDITTRGIVLPGGESLEEMYMERVTLYERFADVTVDCEGLSAERTVERVCRAAAELRII